MNRKVICTNADGFAMEFGQHTFSPFILENLEGVYTVEANLSMNDNTIIDGSSYLGSTVRSRNILITLTARDEHQNNRSLLYSLFPIKTKGTLTYKEGEETREIAYIVESINPDGSGHTRSAVVSLLCPDPYFYDLDDVLVEMAGWSPAFEFQHEFQDGGEELGTRIQEKLKVINNTSPTEGIGLTILISAEGNVTNPGMLHMQQGEQITVGTASKPLTLTAGDRLRITTGTDNKRVVLISGGTETNVNQYLSEDSSFIQLNRGENSLWYFAESGEDNLNVLISFRYRYLGV